MTLNELEYKLHINIEYKLALLNTKAYRENKGRDTSDLDEEIAELNEEIKAQREELRALRGK